MYLCADWSPSWTSSVTFTGSKALWYFRAPSCERIEMFCEEAKKRRILFEILKKF